MIKYILLSLISFNCFASENPLTIEKIEVNLGGNMLTRAYERYNKYCITNEPYCYCKEESGNMSIEIPCYFYDKLKEHIKRESK